VALSRERLWALVGSCALLGRILPKPTLTRPDPVSHRKIDPTRGDLDRLLDCARLVTHTHGKDKVYSMLRAGLQGPEALQHVTDVVKCRVHGDLSCVTRRSRQVANLGECLVATVAHEVVAKRVSGVLLATGQRLAPSRIGSRLISSAQ